MNVKIKGRVPKELYYIYTPETINLNGYKTLESSYMIAADSATAKRTQGKLVSNRNLKNVKLDYFASDNFYVTIPKENFISEGIEVDIQCKISAVHLPDMGDIIDGVFKDDFKFIVENTDLCVVSVHSPQFKQLDELTDLQPININLLVPFSVYANKKNELFMYLGKLSYYIPLYKGMKSNPYRIRKYILEKTPTFNGTQHTFFKISSYCKTEEDYIRYFSNMYAIEQCNNKVLYKKVSDTGFTLNYIKSKIYASNSFLVDKFLATASLSPTPDLSLFTQEEQSLISSHAELEFDERAKYGF